MPAGCSGEREEARGADELQTQDPVESPAVEIVDLREAFNGINGCAVLFSARENKYSLYDRSMCEREASPYSTFKIVSTLLGLRSGILEAETSTMSYNGTQYPVSQWNGNLTLREAFRSSCVWYFRQVIDEVGQAETEKALEALSYGNCDVSEWNGSQTNSIEELNGFWLNSSLKISPLEQVGVLSDLFEGRSQYSEEDIAVLKNIMLVDGDGARNIYGKTGSGPTGEAWFVGFTEEAGDDRYFAVYLNDEQKKETISGDTAKEIALKILQ